MNFATTLVVRLLVTALAIAAIAGQVAHIDALSHATLGLSDTLVRNPRPSFLTLVVANAVVSTLSGILAIVLVVKGEKDRGAIGLAVALGVWAYLLAYSGIIVLFRPDPGLLRSVFEGHFLVVEALGLAGLIHFTAGFPRGIEPTSDMIPDTLPFGERALRQVQVYLLAPKAPWIGAGIVLVLVFGLNRLAGGSVADAALHPLMDVVTFGAVAFVVVNLRRSWIHSAGDDRTRMWWIVVGLELLVGSLALLISGNILITATGWPEPAFAWRPILLNLGLVGLIGGLGMAVFYRGTLDAEGLGRRVFSGLTLATFVLVGATGVEVLFSSALVGRISLPAGLGTAMTVIAAGATYGRTLPFLEKVLGQLPGLEEDQPAAE